MHSEIFSVLPPPFSNQAPWEVLAAEEEEEEEGEEGREEGREEPLEGGRVGRREGGREGEGMEIRPVVVVGDEGTSRQNEEPSLPLSLPPSSLTLSFLPSFPPSPPPPQASTVPAGWRHGN